LSQIEVLKNKQTGDEKKAPQAKKAMERFHPTVDNPIQEMKIGLWKIMDQTVLATRVIAILTNGQVANIP